MKKLLLSFCLLLTALSSWAHDFEVDGIYYNIYSSINLTVAVTFRGDKYNSYSNEYTGEAVIPSSVTYSGKTYRVTSIGEAAFFDCSGLTSVSIPESVTTIGDYAFRGCSGLTSVTIPNSVTSIGVSAFSGCYFLSNSIINNSALSNEKNWGATIVDEETKDGLLIKDNTVIKCRPWAISVTTPNSVTSIGSSAFSGCSGLTSVAIGEGVTSIGDYAFQNCNGLTSVTIGNSVTSIGSSAFYGCSGLISITIPSSVTSIGYYAFYNCYFMLGYFVNNSALLDDNNWGATIYDLETNDGLLIKDNTVVKCRPWAISVTIPENVTSIGNYAFSGCRSLTSIIIPNSVTSIGGGAFNGCSGLTSVSIPESVTTIGDYAFQNCNGLTSVTIGNSVTSIGRSAFSGCWGLTSVTIGNSVTSIGSSAFYGCSGLTSVTIPNSVTSIGSSAFSACSGLTSISIPESVIEIGSSAFFDTNWYNNQPDGLVYAGKVAYKYKGTMPENTSITLNDGTLGIAEGAFTSCRNLTSITIPNSVTSIGYSAFRDCSSLTSITIPNSVTSIGKYAFQNCSGLTSVTIPNSVTSIDGSAFSGCTGVLSANVDIPKFGQIIRNMTSLRELTIGSNCNLPISEGQFNNNPYLTTVTINSNAIISMEYEYDHSLSERLGPNVTNCILGDSVKVIGGCAFNDCTNLTTVTIGKNVTSIDESAFSGCRGLTSVTIPNSVTSIGEGAFFACSGLISLTIGEGVTSIGEDAFRYCSGLTSVTINSNNIASKEYGKATYSNGYNKDLSGIFGSQVTNYTFGGGVKSIGREACYGLIELKTVIIGDSVTSIGWNAFYGCSGLAFVTIGNGVTSIGDWAFYDCTSVNTLEVGATKVPANLFGLTPANIKNVTILDGVREIEANAFKNCTNLERCSFESVEGLLTIKFGNGYANPLCQNKVLNIGDKIVTELAIPESITEVKDYALFNCKSLKSVTEGENVKTIGVSAFSGNTKLTKVVLGSQVEKIGNTAFSQCPLTSIYSYAEVPPTCGNNVFTMNAEECKLYVPSASVSRYQNHQDWYEFDIQPMISTFKLTYMVDGEVYKTFTVDSGSTITAEPNPYKEGYTFSGWSELPETMPENDVVVTGTFTVNNYTLTYKVDGEVYKTTSVPYGTELSAENEPTKEGHTFSGWSEIPETMPANDVEITGTFTVNTYKVTFMYGDEVLKTIEVEYGAEIPLPESLDSERYTLVEWLDVPETMPAQDIIIRADFTDGIESIRNAQMHNEGIYDLSGRKLSRMQKGINVIRMKDGNTRKVLVK